MKTLNTVRLALRPLSDADLPTFARLHGDPEMTARMHRGALGADEADELFCDYQQAFAANGFGMRAVCWRETDEMIGECGLWMRESAGGYTLRYMLFQNWWGQGLTGEAARASVSEAFGAIGLDALYAVAMDGNQHSVKALLRLGMIKVEDDHRGISGFGRYQLTAETFRRPGD
ncbi:MAG: GNAT family N-acetyltransferase [Rhodospirillaceae bacterium]|nr:GNAT family N-acetyltransferase [Rhodospirillaceae bacterium]